MASKYILTPKFRMAFVSLTKREIKPGPEAKEGGFGLVMLFPKATTDLSALQAIMAEAVSEKWPDPNKRPTPLRSPIRDGDQKPDLEGYPGCWYAHAWSNHIIGVVDANCQRVLDVDGQAYAGRWAIAQVNAWGYSNTGNNGVSLGLANVQLLEDAPRLAGNPDPTKAFKPIAVTPAAPGFGTPAPAAAPQWTAPAAPPPIAAPAAPMWN